MRSNVQTGVVYIGATSPTRLAEVAVEARDVSFSYNEDPVLAEVSFKVQSGEFVSIIGPSGCGMSTLLLILGGLIRPRCGSVVVNGHEIFGPGEERAMVFQHFALLPWKTALENVVLALRYRQIGSSRKERRQLARQHLALVGLERREGLYPHQLSGGMRQRVGLARAFAAQSPVLLMDEPFGALDAQTAELMREELRTLVAQESRTVILITHNLDEAIYLSDRVIVMASDPGRVVQTLTIGLSHPRGPNAGLQTEREQYLGYRDELWEFLRSEARRTQVVRG